MSNVSNLSDTAHSILVLLNNANELIVKSSDRKNAADVMRAITAYAKGKNYPLNQERLDNFGAVLYDARPYTLTMIIKDIADEVMLIEQKALTKRNKEVVLNKKKKN
jgi:hypothetical protein